MVRIADVSRNQIESFLELAWSAEDAERSGTSAPRDWRCHEYCLAAYDGQEIVAAAVFQVRGGVASLNNVISRGRRHLGVGGMLVEEFIQRARALGCRKVTLRTSNEDTLLRFYRRVRDRGDLP